MTYSAGLVGLGKIGVEHGDYYAANDAIDLVAIADVDDETLRDMARRWDVPTERCYRSHAELLESEAVDVVSVATPTYLHHEHTVAIAEARHPPDLIWCEKPIAASVAQADEMVAACGNAGVELMINHKFRWTRGLQTLRTLLADEAQIGSVRSVSVQWQMELLRSGTHFVDALVYLLDSDPASVSGYLTGEEQLSQLASTEVDIDDCGGGGHIVMDDGTFVTVDFTLPRQVRTGLFHVVGTRGKTSLDIHDGEWRYWRNATEPPVDGGGVDDAAYVETTLRELRDRWSPPDDDFMRSAVENVVTILDGTGENRSPGREATTTLEILVGMVVSHHTGSHVSLPLARPLREVTVTSW